MQAGERREVTAAAALADKEMVHRAAVAAGTLAYFPIVFHLLMRLR